MEELRHHAGQDVVKTFWMNIKKHFLIFAYAIVGMNYKELFEF
jgi:hypothetical protein